MHNLITVEFQVAIFPLTNETLNYSKKQTKKLLPVKNKINRGSQSDVLDVEKTLLQGVVDRRQ